jgi:hypothetical protein
MEYTYYNLNYKLNNKCGITTFSRLKLTPFTQRKCIKYSMSKWGEPSMPVPSVRRRGRYGNHYDR